METEPSPVPPGMPLWVKVFIAIGIVGVLVLVGVVALGGTEHGPRRHLGGDSGESPSESGSPTPSSNQTTPAPGTVERSTRGTFSMA